MSRRLDQVFLVVVVLLLGIGIVQVYSSSYIYATETRGDGLFFFRRQAMFAVAGIAMLFGAAWVRWHWWMRLIPIVWGGLIAALAATLVPGLGVAAGGAVRWLRLGGGLHIEPSEFLKVALPLYLAWACGLERPWARRWAVVGWLIPLGVLLKQPDFGSFAIYLLITLGLLIAQGLRWRWVAWGAAVAAPIFYFLVMKVPYRAARVMAFLDPWSDADDKGFQVIQSMLSFHSGGLFGVGLGQGQGKLFFLPESHTDFTMAVLGEELGFVGLLMLMFLFGVLIFRGFLKAYHAATQDRMLGALGVTLVLATGALLNACVALGLVPTKGLAMPFLSYGGSHLLAMCWAVGVLLSSEQTDSKVGGGRSIKGLIWRGRP